MSFELLKCFLEQNPSLANSICYIHQDVLDVSGEIQMQIMFEDKKKVILIFSCDWQ